MNKLKLGIFAHYVLGPFPQEFARVPLVLKRQPSLKKIVTCEFGLHLGTWSLEIILFILDFFLKMPAN